MFPLIFLIIYVCRLAVSLWDWKEYLPSEIRETRKQAESKFKRSQYVLWRHVSSSFRLRFNGIRKAEHITATLLYFIHLSFQCLLIKKNGVTAFWKVQNYGKTTFSREYSECRQWNIPISKSIIQLSIYEIPSKTIVVWFILEEFTSCPLEFIWSKLWNKVIGFLLVSIR